MKLQIPTQTFTSWQENLTQMFAQSRAMYVQSFPDMIYGHNGLDFISPGLRNGYGSKILAAHDFQSVVIDTDFPTKQRGNGIYLRGLLPVPFMVNGTMAYYIESCYWHLSDFEVTPDIKNGKAGDVIGLMGNAGFVIPRPTPKEPWNGTHLHFGIRFYDVHGNIIHSQFSGDYVDPLPFLFSTGEKIGTQAFLRSDMTLGSYGDQVSKLQSLLSLSGDFNDEPTGQYGPKTFSAVQSFQKKCGIVPLGVCGPKTRMFINNLYN